MQEKILKVNLINIWKGELQNTTAEKAEAASKHFLAIANITLIKTVIHQ